MNVCLLTPTFLPKIGGVEMVVAALGEQYQRLGASPQVVTQWPRKGRGTPDDNAMAYPVIRYRRPWSFTWRLGMASITRALETAWRKQPFDIIHCHLAYPAGFVAMRFAKKHNIPVVITPHGSDIRAKCRFRQRPAVWKRVVDSLQHADAVTALNDEMHQLLVEILGTDDHIVSIANGVDIEGINQPAEFQESFPAMPRNDYALYLGGLTDKKGVDVLLEAMALLNTSGAAIPLIIAGTGRMEEELRAYADANGLGGCVHFVGSAQGDFKRYLFQHCKFVVMPSRTEAFGIVALEAYACGKPVIASEIGGLSLLIEDGTSGLLVPAEHPQALADAMTSDAICTIAQDPKTLQARVEQYDWSHIAQTYIDLYQKLLQ